VVEVDPDSDAQRAGIAKADRVVTLNGEPANGAFEDDIAKMHPGDTITMTLANRRGERRVKLHLASRAEQSYEVQDISSPTPEQRSHRTAWMRGDDEGGGVP
jgi:predicted metalloprotease with PDZ domain